MILKYYLTDIIPLNINELNQFGSISVEVIRFEDDLIAMGKDVDQYAISKNDGVILPFNMHGFSSARKKGFLTEADRELRDFVENIDVHYTNRKRDTLLKQGRAIIMSDDFKVIPVKDLDQDGMCQLAIIHDVVKVFSLTLGVPSR